MAEPARGRLEVLRAAIEAEAPLAHERMSYGMPTWHQNENLIHIAGYARHVGVYPGPEAIVVFAAALAPFKTSKGAIQIPHDHELPVDLVRELTRWRVAQVAAQPPKKKKR